MYCIVVEAIGTE